MSTETGPAVDAGPRGHRIVPGPKGLPFLGNMPQFGKNPLAFFERLRGHGDLVQWRFGPNSCVFIADPECIGELLTETERTFDQPALGIAFRTVMGNGVVVARGADWRRKRSLVQPSVRPKQVRSYAATMAGSTVELADTWSGGRRIDIKREMAALTQKIAVRTIFGVDTPADAEAMGRAMDVAQAEIGKEFAGIGALLPDWVPTPGRARIKKAAAVIDAEVGRVVARHREGTDDRPDLLSRLLTAVDETGAKLDDREIRDETVTLYIGGHETTSSTLVWAWYLLSRNPGARAALSEELDRVLGDREPGFDDYAQLPYTQAVVKETLRLYPTIWLVTGVAKEGARIGGLPIPEGTRVWSSQWATHRDERWFPEPEEFRPERWDPETGDEIAEYAWFPFGGGPRVCLGTRFAMVEAVLILAVLARRFDLDVDPGTVNPVPTLTLQPDREVMATVRAR
ncbi:MULTISPECIES: cytochrome P450 [unclassified Streptomyces]|uniref:cytochrome P450 n=1 Tax=unclassified Streptomyces TaxID=2593676 RepID=UPI0022591B80|nr:MULTISPECIES: cytochrome P450 [unclassified Streptomyces]MCX5144270.1 cytochrome P450 [Streptomyces sp. NBC_00338]WRZ68640.1 cytochrome P450 [Streptomyces sp. NBC_01257]